MARHAIDAFTGAGEKHCRYDASRFVVVPVAYEGTVTYLKGTKRGPAAILEASRNMETWDEVLGRETVEKDGIHTLAPLAPKEAPEFVADRLEQVVDGILGDAKVPCVIGGEHSISLGPIRAAARRFPELGIVHLDAHTDLRDSYEGTKYGHGCVMRRALQHAPITQVGIRSLSGEEAALVAARSEIRTFFAHERVGADWPPRGLLSKVPPQVYLSIDMDVFDPALVPGVGTPEPGGLSWEEVVAVVAEVCRHREVVAFDVVETRPIPGAVVSEFTAAKLIYRICGQIAVAAEARRRPSQAIASKDDRG